MEIADAEMWAMMSMEEYGLLEQGWTLVWDRAKCRAGLCDYASRQISLSRYLTVHRPEDQVMNTVTHEVAHALVGPMHGHDRVWQAKFIELGGSGKRSEFFFDRNAPWIGVCGHGKHFHRYRQPGRGPYRCRCRGGFGTLAEVEDFLSRGQVAWRRNVQGVIEHAG